MGSGKNHSRYQIVRPEDRSEVMGEVEGCTFNGLYVPCELCELQDKLSECIEMRERTNVQVKYKEVSA